MNVLLHHRYHICFFIWCYHIMNCLCRISVESFWLHYISCYIFYTKLFNFTSYSTLEAKRHNKRIKSSSLIHIQNDQYRFKYFVEGDVNYYYVTNLNGRLFSIDSWYSYGYQLFPTSRIAPLLI